MRSCTVEGCNNKHYGKGYCKKHWQQWSRHGKILDRTRFDANEYVIHEDYVEIILYSKNNKEMGRTIVDKEFHDKIVGYKWCIGNMGYVVTVKQGKTILLHRLIMGCEDDYDGMIVDHIDGNILNNRSSNLRMATKQQNMFNTTNVGGGCNNRKGTHFNKAKNKWEAYITVNHKKINLGRFDTEEEAVIARKEAELRYFGEYRRCEEVE